MSNLQTGRDLVTLPQGLTGSVKHLVESHTPTLPAVNFCCFSDKETPGLQLFRHRDTAALPEDMANFTSPKRPEAAAVDLPPVLDCVLLPALAMLGAAGNCLCAAIFLRQRYRPVATPLLLALCLSDTAFLLCTFLVRLACLVSRADRQTGATFRVIMTPQVDVFRCVLAHVTVLLTSALGVERCVAVTRPFKQRVLCTSARLRTAALVLCGAVLAAMTPAFFQQDVVPHRSPHDDGENNATVVYRLHDTAFYLRNRAVLDFYLRFTLPLLLRALPFVATWVCLVVILVGFRRRLRLRTRPQRPAGHRAARPAKSERPSTADNADLVLEEKNVTKACVVVLVIYVTCELPGLAWSLAKMARRDFQHATSNDHILEIVYNVASLSEVLNSAINFPAYSVMHKHFLSHSSN